MLAAGAGFQAIMWDPLCGTSEEVSDILAGRRDDGKLRPLKLAHAAMSILLTVI